MRSPPWLRQRHLAVAALGQGLDRSSVEQAGVKSVNATESRTRRIPAKPPHGVALAPPPNGSGTTLTWPEPLPAVSPAARCGAKPCAWRGTALSALPTRAKAASPEGEAALLPWRVARGGGERQPKGDWRSHALRVSPLGGTQLTTAEKLVVSSPTPPLQISNPAKTSCRYMLLLSTPRLTASEMKFLRSKDSELVVAVRT